MSKRRVLKTNAKREVQFVSFYGLLPVRIERDVRRLRVCVLLNTVLKVAQCLNSNLNAGSSDGSSGKGASAIHFLILYCCDV